MGNFIAAGWVAGGNRPGQGNCVGGVSDLTADRTDSSVGGYSWI